MVVTQTEAQSEMERRSIKAAWFAVACNISSLVLGNIDADLHVGSIGDYRLISYPDLVVQCGYLTPILVVIFFRRVTAVTFTFALTLFVILVGRIHNLRQSRLGLHPAIWADLLSTLLGLFSVFFLLMLAAKALEILVANTLKRRNAARPEIRREPHADDPHA